MPPRLETGVVFTSKTPLASTDWYTPSQSVPEVQ